MDDAGRSAQPLPIVSLICPSRQRTTKRAIIAYKPLATHISLCLFVVMMEQQIFKALADPTRHLVFSKLADGPHNATELRAGLEISQPAMSQHLAVLQAAGLVLGEKQGRHVSYRVNPDGLLEISRWLQRYRAFWPTRVENLEQLLKEMDQ